MSNEEKREAPLSSGRLSTDSSSSPDAPDSDTGRMREEKLLQSHEELEMRVRERTEELARANEALKAEIAERTKLEETLEESIIRLKRAERIKSDFLSRVSHELRNPLTMISGYMDLLTASRLGPLTVEQSEALTVANKHVERLQCRIEDLLSLSMIDSGQLRLDMSTVDIADLTEKRVTFFKGAYDKKGLYLKLQVESNLPKVSGDSRRLMPVIDNLLDNACKFTDRGGVTIRIRRYDKWVRFEIADTGVGISGEEISNIFERFYQAEPVLTRTREGTGLGLSIVKILVDIQGGRIWAESPGRGCGSTFIVLLPIK